MAGIYVHIPFCRQKCYYCDFYKSVNTSLSGKFIEILADEIILRKNFLSNEKIETIYFGGGTPSVLTQQEIKYILEIINDSFDVYNDAEITFEANPDDLDESYLSELLSLGINRLSIGVQSLIEKQLKKMNRRHNVPQALDAVKNAVIAGFRNISLDLIYGLPGLTNAQWKTTLSQIFELPFQHLSAYHLTFHEGTPYHTWLKKGIIKELEETQSLKHFKTLIQYAGEADFEHYEISNFAKDKKYSKHNSSYWSGKKYLGLGPSAHSFNGEVRQWNVASIERYIKAVERDDVFFEEEVLTEKEKFNEYILTGMRTKWGVNLGFIEKNFGKNKANYFSRGIEKYLKSKLVVKDKGVFTIQGEGLFISDEIMSDLMII